MEIKTKYSLGDRVWYVQNNTCEKKVACEVCNDTKEITIKDVLFACPNCVTKHNNNRWVNRYYVAGNSIIGQVRTEYNEVIDYGDYRDLETTEKHEYKLRATGVGSGSIWTEDKLFSTKEEAQAFCDLKNTVAETKLTNYLR